MTPANIISQNALITINQDKIVSVDEIFDIIQSQTSYTFIYRSDLFNDMPPVTLKKSTIKVKDLLSNVISSSEYTFGLLKDNTIVVEEKVSRVIQEEIIGNVTDEKNIPLAGVGILIEGTRRGTLTDFDGDYRIRGLKTTDVLVFSFMGFEKQYIEVGDKKVINVVLKESSNELDEVVVSGKKIVNTGYQVVSKAKSVGSFETVGAEVIETKFQTNILDRIEGTVSGLSMYRGTPVIRGVSTILGESYPLIILDGAVYNGDLESINPNDIESVTVLKDASAASIYGSRAANGVIVVTTKGGYIGKPTLSYTSSYQIESQPSRSYQNLMSSSEFVDYQVDVFNRIPTPAGDEKNPDLALDEVNTLLYAHRDGLISTDYLNSELNKLRGLDGYSQVEDILITPKYTQQHSLALRGGSKIHQYALSLNYASRGSFNIDSASENIGLNIKNYFRLNDWLKVDATLISSYGFSDNYGGVSGIGLLGPSRLPYEVLKDEDGNPAEWNHIKSHEKIDELISKGLLDQSYYPLNELKEVQTSSKSPSVNINFGTEAKLSKSFNLQLRGQLQYGETHSEIYASENSYTVRDMINNSTQIINGEVINNIPYGGQLTETFYDRNSYTLRAQLNYSKLFNQKHDVKVFVGGERNKAVTESYGFKRYGYDPEYLTFESVDEATLAEGITGTESNSGLFTLGGQTGYQNTDIRYISAYANVSYMFDDKLGLNVSARIDESNLFGKNPEYAYRPLWSFGANYIIDTESLSVSWLDRLKVRATYGISGNVYDNGGPEAIVQISGVNAAEEQIAVISTPPNEELRWEQTNITNIGIDYELFSRKLTGTLEFYDRSTTDAISRIDSDPILGWSQLPKNYASLNNRGVELQMNAPFLTTRDFRWGGSLILNYNRNIVTEYVPEYTTFNAYDYLYENYLVEGQALNAIYTVRYAGLDEKGAPRAYKADGTIVETYSDLTLEDLKVEGTNDPPYHASFSSNISYKQLNLSFLFIYYGGHVQRDVAAGHTQTYKYPYDITRNLDRVHLNYWKEPGDEADIYKAPAINWNNTDLNENPDYIQSSQRNLWTYADIHVQKADYMKIRNITLSYNASNEILEKINFSSLRFSFDVRNPFLWTYNRNNLDPEVWTGDSSRGTAIMPTYTFAINLKF
ncbi:SusC/RagA family TonB-linked outer membrane protein [Pseudotamlana agarivorans]|uniref:SusC/RagA family TonB-linked outer membrane protein n=1 Tax=Pseudotamlana agarivorans TaxID=481183 RepID=UPI0008319186|nr:SusC/RagA family TonB-linked outer membrane protein [Tamlana agarivorans]